MNTIPAIEIRGLTKALGDKQVLLGVDLTAHRGQVLALLGSNGAGKTTLVRMYEILGEVEREWGRSEVEPLLVEAADLILAQLEDADAAGTLQEQWPGEAGETQLLDAFAEDAHPAVVRLRELVAERGWTGWTRMERRAAATPPA